MQIYRRYKRSKQFWMGLLNINAHLFNIVEHLALPDLFDMHAACVEYHVNMCEHLYALSI